MPLQLNTASSGSVTLSPANTASSYTLTVPATTDTIATLSNVGVYNSFKNRIINGQMMIDQRNAGASVTVNSGTSGFSLDRFGYNNQSGANITIQRSSVVPVGFQNSLLVTVTSSNSPTSSQFGRLYQGIEGFNMSDLAWGTANAQSISISFWVRSSVTGTHSMVLNNGAGSYAYPFTYTISSANTYEYKTVTIPGPTAGTWGTDNSCFCYLSIGFGSGSSTVASAGSWASASGFVNGATGSVNLCATNGATFYITGVQLEKGTSATAFDYRPYGTELALCQRYYCTTGNMANPDTNSAAFNGTVLAVNGSYARVGASFKQTMRTTPTIVLYDGNGVSGTCTQVGVADAIAASAQVISYTGFGQVFKTSGAFTTTAGYPIVGGFTASAEL